MAKFINYKETGFQFGRNMLDNLLAELESIFPSDKQTREFYKTTVFNRVRVLKSEGYADDVALSVSMKELLPPSYAKLVGKY